MLHLYSAKKSTRFTYTTKLVFGDLLGYDFQVHHNQDDFEMAEGAKLIYGYSDANMPQLLAHNLLFETDTKIQELNVDSYEGTPILFAYQQNKSILPFDPLAAIFYMASRYEEYLPHQCDAHQRYAHQDSVAYKHHFLQLPIAHLWADILHKALQNQYPYLHKAKKAYNFIPTYDIDAAWCYKHKGLTRNVGGLLRDSLQANFSAVKERIAVLSNRKKDPFDSFTFLHQLQKKYNHKPIYFILFGDLGPFDKNISPTHPAFRKLVSSLRDRAKIGIHPSYASNANSRILEKEHKNLSIAAHTEIIRSRQHFLKLELPRSYRHLLNIGIQHDYSMGYAGALGFRAGMAQAFQFYDLDLDVSTPLIIHPFMLMDGTLVDYLQVDSETAKRLINPLIEATKAVNGEFISLFHNESFSEKGRWIGWTDVYTHLLEQATP